MQLKSFKVYTGEWERLSRQLNTAKIISKVNRLLHYIKGFFSDNLCFHMITLIPGGLASIQLQHPISSQLLLPCVAPTLGGQHGNYTGSYHYHTTVHPDT